MVCGLDAALGARRGHAGVFLPGQSTMTTRFLTLAARGESPASHRGRRGAPLTRRDDREYREYLREEQRSQRGCIAGRMQLEFHHGLLALVALAALTAVWVAPVSAHHSFAAEF